MLDCAANGGIPTTRPHMLILRTRDALRSPHLSVVPKREPGRTHHTNARPPAPPPPIPTHRTGSVDVPAEDALRVREHAQLLRLGEEGRVQDRLRDGLDVRKGRDEGGDVGVVGAEDELAGGDAVAEEAFDLVVEDGTGAVVPEAGWGRGGLVLMGWYGGEGLRVFGRGGRTACCRSPLRIVLALRDRISGVCPRRWAMRLLRGGAGS